MGKRNFSRLMLFLVITGSLVIFSGCVGEKQQPNLTTPTPLPTTPPIATPSSTPPSISTVTPTLTTTISTPTVTVTPIQTPAEPILITAPLDKASVPERPFVEGMVNNSNAIVWVIVHPVQLSDYWVQQPVTVKRDGTWRVMIYIGQPGTSDVGKEFEIMAIANPKVKLTEGKFPEGGWPEAEWKSDVILVKRQ